MTQEAKAEETRARGETFALGLNPYGLAYHLGLQGAGGPRANRKGAGLEGFVDIAIELGAKTLEIFDPWLRALSDDDLRALRDRLGELGMTPVVSSGLMMGPFESALRSARILDAKVIRYGLTTVLCGDRNALGEKWKTMVADVRTALAERGPRAADEGRLLAIENHQDFGSEELVRFCEEARGVRICFDTGNTFPVAEAPLDFARRIAPYVAHVHLKDYRVQFTDEGYRLVRCAIGDGAVPMSEVLDGLAKHHRRLTAVLEPGALEARHVRLLRPEWWNGYPPKSAEALAACLAAARVNRLAEEADFRTPWERGEDGAIGSYELGMIRRSAANMRAIGLTLN
ncbi:MAG: sugar phosphate isomerase/epimerase [Hyphomicrobiales bacterium]|nr:sugar phosphate isomerase/epimerase [Hyphomicrobiales bacterium]MBV8443094.1 sugar phosphate isomerase/epimerase [Hyphomicrobiales bacterium]